MFLIAGLGNIFQGDDAFGVFTVRRLARQAMPEDVRIVDFGTRSDDLAFALMDDYRAIILVDAMARGLAPGTVCLIEPTLETGPAAEVPLLDGHQLNADRALSLARHWGGHPAHVYVVGCEPASLEPVAEEIALTPPVEAAVPQAIEMIQSLLAKLRAQPALLEQV